jgi:class 3 adenylate cyclase
VAQALLSLQASADASALEPQVNVPTVVIDRPAAIWRGPGIRRAAGLAIPAVRFVEVDGIDWLPWLPDSEAVVAEIEEVMTGERSERGAARALLTVMFSDVVGSTDSAVRLGDAGWRDVLETHDRLLRRELDRHGGSEVDSAGDGFLATFATPTQAVRCAERLHRAMEPVGVRLRIGIHCGEVEVREHNLAGVAIHLAARVQAKAEPGQTLVTSTVREAMIGSGARMSSQGTFELKGIPDRWELFGIER